MGEGVTLSGVWRYLCLGLYVMIFSAMTVTSWAQAPGAFNLLGPTNNEQHTWTSVSLDWEDSSDATFYHLYFGTSTNPSQDSIGTISSSDKSGLSHDTTYYWYVVASNASGTARSPASGDHSFRTTWQYDNLITTTTTIDTNDTTYDNKSVLIDGATVTINGTHGFSNLYILGGATIQHSAATASLEHYMELLITNDLVVSSNSAINVDGRGYLEGRTVGNTTSGASSGNSGGSYGGLGGGTPNDAYGDFRNPNELGSGGGGTGGDGGGLVRIAADRLEIEGVISANGENGDAFDSGGSGGGLHLNIGTLAGNGEIRAKGGEMGYGANGSHGGGGGRIAVYYGLFDSFDPTNQITAAGGDAPNGVNVRAGSAGTVYLKKTGEVGTLVVNNAGVITDKIPYATPLTLPNASNYLENIVLSGTGTEATVSSGNIVASNLIIRSGAMLTHLPATTSEEFTLKLVVLGTLSVEADGSVDVSGRGYEPGYTLGNTTVGASTDFGGGSHGGLGGVHWDSVNATYGDEKNPNELGSGSGPNGASSGGGLVRVTAGTLELEGVIRADGETPSAGGSGGGIYIDTGILTGSGIISADGSSTSPGSTGGGGGGRVAIYYGSLDGFDLTNDVTAAGGTSAGNPGSDGTVYETNRVAPVALASVDPSSAAPSPITDIDISFTTPMDVDSVSTANISLIGPGEESILLANIAETSLFDYRLDLTNDLAAEGSYRLEFSTNLMSILGGRFNATYTNAFAIDDTAPAAPVVTNYLASIDTNKITASTPTLQGTREADTAVWVDGSLAAVSGSGEWSYQISALSEGQNTVHVHAIDLAGNSSTTNPLYFWLDTIPPPVTAVSPPNGFFTNDASIVFDVTFSENNSGLDLGASTIEMHSGTQEGPLVPGDKSLAATNVLRFDPSGSLLDNTYYVIRNLKDNHGNTDGDIVTSFTVDQTPPAIPILNTVTSPTIVAQYPFSGTKDANTAIYLDGNLHVANDASTSWSITTNVLDEGTNLLTFTARDQAGNFSGATNVYIFYDNVVPGAVTVTALVEGSGSAITLDWTAYDESSNGGDIDFYTIFQHTSDFTDAGDATAIGTNAAGDQTFAISGLTRNETLYYAVIAQDLTEQVDSNVTAIAATPVDINPPPVPTNIYFEVFETNLVLHWEPSPGADPDSDLDGYALFFESVLEERISNTGEVYNKNDLAASSNYAFEVRCFDQDGNTNAGLSVTGYTLLDNPTNLLITPFDGYVAMTWHAVAPTQNVDYYAIYVSTSDFASVTGMTPAITATATNAMLAGFDNDVTNFFAVTAVNKSGGERKEVATTNAVTADDLVGPTIANLLWESGTIASNIVAPGSFTLSADDPAGMSRVEFKINSTIIATDANGTTNFSAFWNVSTTTNDGSFAFDVIAYDTLGNSTTYSTNLNVQIAALGPPVITSPLTELNVNRSVLIVSGTGAVYASAVAMFIDDVEQTNATVSVTPSGNFTATITLGAGTNTIEAAAVNRAGNGTKSASIDVIYDASVPTPPIGISASPREDGQIRLSWSPPLGVDVQGYDIYRSSSPFTNISDGTLVNPSRLFATFHTDLPGADGTYYYRLVTINLAGSTSAPSAQASASSDGEAPHVLSVAYESDGVVDPANSNRFGVGSIDVTLTLSERLLTTPFFTITPNNGTPISVELRPTSTNTYVGSFQVTENTACGTAYAVFSGRDLIGNRGTTIDAGGSITVDVCGPQASGLTVNPEAPIQNNDQTPTSVVVVIAFPTNDIPASTPALSYVLSSTETNAQSVSLTMLSSASWYGTVNFSTNAGNPAEMLQFTYAGVDDIGNTGTTVNATTSFQVYQGDLPPLDPPTGLAGVALPNGVIQLTWDSVDYAAGYAVHKGSVSNGTAPYAANTGEVAYTESAGDATNWYSVATIRSANGQVSTSAVSEAIMVISDTVAPVAPSNLTLSLAGTGVKVGWSDDSGDTVTYALYRDDADISSVSSLTSLFSSISSTNKIDSNPEEGLRYYAVTAVDQAGNESDPSISASTNLSLLPVNTLAVRLVDGSLPLVSWTHANSNNVSGYNLYVGGSKLNQALLANSESFYSDTGYNTEDRTYAIAAVDVVGTNEVESAQRSILLPQLSCALDASSTLKRGIINRLTYTVYNDSTVAVSDVTLQVQAQEYTSASSSFDLDAGGSETVSVVVGGHTNLAAIVTLTNTLVIAPNAGESVQIVSEEQVEVGDDLLVAEILNDEFVRGGQGDARFVLHNTSDEEIEVIMATSSGSADSSDVRFKLLTTDGNVISATSAQQATGDGVITLASGTTVARIQPGESFEADDISLSVPSNAPSAVYLQLEIDTIYYHLGQSDEVSIEGLDARRTLTLVSTPYYAQVTNITPSVSMGDTNILIQGQAINRGAGTPQSLVPVSLTLSLNGFERDFDLYSDTNGNWSYTFIPSADESGVYKVWATHPDVLDKPNQGQFTITDVKVSPRSFAVNVPKNYQATLNIGVTSSEGLTLTNLHVAYDAADQPSSNYVGGVHVDVGPTTAVMNANSSTTLQVTVWADNTATNIADLVLRVKSDQSGSEGWAALSIACTFSEAPPFLTWTPGYVDTGIAISNTITEIITLKNQGFDDMLDVTLSLTDTNGSPAPRWIALNAPTNFGDIAAGASREISLTFAPTNGVSETQYEFDLNISSLNHTTGPIKVYAGVDGSGMGGALFHVVDIFTSASNAQSGVFGLEGARILLQKDSGTLYETSKVTDVNGEAYFAVSDLPVGSYKYRASASKHKSVVGHIFVKSGVVLSEELVLPNELITIEWSVTPTTIEDRYEVVLEATFETDIPAAVVVINPASVTLPDMEPGEVFYGEFEVVNHGLIRADEVEFNLPPDDQYFKFELLSDFPDTIAAHETIYAPYRVTSLQSFDNDDEGAGGGADCGNPYTLCSEVTYEYVCVYGYGIVEKTVGGCMVNGLKGCWTSSPKGGGPINFPIDPAQGLYIPGGKQKPPPASLGSGLGCSQFTCPPNSICCIPGVGGPGGPGASGTPNLPNTTALEEVGSFVSLLTGQYIDGSEDLFVKTLGFSPGIRRAYYDNQWHFIELDVGLEFDIEETRCGGFERLVEIRIGEAVYERKEPALSVRPQCSTGDVSNTAYYQSNEYKYGQIFGVEGDYPRILVLSGGSDGYRWENESGYWREYDTNGLLQAYGDRLNRRVSMQYQGVEITGIFDHWTNQVLWITYTNGLIESASDAVTGGRSVSCQYDASGNLTNFIDLLGNSTVYGYDNTHRITYKRLPNGRERSISYSGGRVASVLNGDGVGKYFDYGFDEVKQEYYASVRTSGGILTEKYFDSTGVEIRRQINGTLVFDAEDDEVSPLEPLKETDANGNVTQLTYPDGSIKTFAYDSILNVLTQEVSVLGVTNRYQFSGLKLMTNRVEGAGLSVELVTRYAYSEVGLLTNRTIIADETIVTTWIYDDAGNMLVVTDPNDNAVSNTYDNLGNVLTHTDAENNTWSFAYDPAGKRVAMTDPLNRVETNGYDAAGNLTTVVDVGGRMTVYEYDAEHLLTKVTDPFGVEEILDYDVDGKLLKIMDGNEREVLFEYNTRGQIVRESESEGDEVMYTYDEDHRLKTVTDADGNTRSITYDESTGFKSSVAYPSYVRNFSYDVRGRLAKTVDNVLGEMRTNSYAYDRVGNLTRNTDAEGRETVSTYDALGRRLSTVNAVSSTNRVTYDLRGNIISLTDAAGNMTELEYDLNNRLIRQTYADDSFYTYSYDAAGRLIQRVDAKGQKITYIYDAVGQLVTNSFYATTNAPSASRVVSYAYDAYGRMIFYDDGVTSGNYTYDDSNRAVHVSIDFGEFSKTYSYTYDAEGRKSTFVRPDGATNIFDHDVLGRLGKIEVPGEGSISYAQHTTFLPGRMQLPGGSVSTFLYDPFFGMRSNRVEDIAGRLLMDRVYNRDKTGAVTSQNTEDGLHTYTYDDIGQLTGVDYPELTSESFTYDSVGNRMQTVDEITNSYSVNNLNQYLSVSSAVSVVHFTYDANGNMTMKVVDSVTNRLGYDTEDRLVGFSNTATSISADYYYDPFGRRLRKVVNGVTNWFLYADEGLIAEYDNTGKEARSYGYLPDSPWLNSPLYLLISGEQATNYYYYINDHLGAPQKLVTKAGVEVWNAEFEAFGRAATVISSSITNHLRFSSQYYDEESGLHYNTFRYYSEETASYNRNDPIGRPGFVSLALGHIPRPNTFFLQNSLSIHDRQTWERFIRLRGNGYSAGSGMQIHGLYGGGNHPDYHLGSRYAFLKNSPLTAIDTHGLYGNPVCGPEGCIYPPDPCWGNCPDIPIPPPVNPEPEIFSCIGWVASTALDMMQGATGPTAHCNASCYITSTCGEVIAGILGGAEEYVALYFSMWEEHFKYNGFEPEPGIFEDTVQDLMNNATGVKCASNPCGQNCSACCAEELGTYE